MGNKEKIYKRKCYEVMNKIKDMGGFKEKRIKELEEILLNAESGKLYTFEEAWKNDFEIYYRRMLNRNRKNTFKKQ